MLIKDALLNNFALQLGLGFLLGGLLFKHLADKFEKTITRREQETAITQSRLSVGVFNALAFEAWGISLIAIIIAIF